MEAWRMAAARELRVLAQALLAGGVFARPP